jgi:electron transfer flavoprotein alpha subunit
VELALNGDRLQATRPCYGGSARARYSINGTPQMATLRAKVYDPPERDSSHQAEVVKQPAGVSADSIRVRITGRRKEAVEGVRLEDAAVVVSGGRGVGGPEGFQSLEELAKLMGGAVGASRAVCDLGWYPVATQIGLTGKVVTPDLYIAVGISGASQHMAGISQVKNIVAINKDPEATIFKSSRFGIVGDWKEVVPAFMEKVRELKAG